MVIKVWVADGQPLLRGEMNALETHFPETQLWVRYAESTQRNGRTHFEMCCENHPDVVVLSPGCNPETFFLAESNGFKHLVITSDGIQELFDYVRTKEKIHELLNNRKYQTT